MRTETPVLLALAALMQILSAQITEAQASAPGSTFVSPANKPRPESAREAIVKPPPVCDPHHHRDAAPSASTSPAGPANTRPSAAVSSSIRTSASRTNWFR